MSTRQLITSVAILAIDGQEAARAREQLDRLTVQRCCGRHKQQVLMTLKLSAEPGV
jgi:hypothetical protein